jgi:hypothetical protein
LVYGWAMPLPVVRAGIASVLAAALLALAVAGCKTPPPFPISRSPGTTCGDPCAVMQCPSGQNCTWNEQCQPHCEVQVPPIQFSR